MEGRLANQIPFAKGSLFFLLYGEECAQKMRALACHHDVDVKEKALAIKPKFWSVAPIFIKDSNSKAVLSQHTGAFACL